MDTNNSYLYVYLLCVEVGLDRRVDRVNTRSAELHGVVEERVDSDKVSVNGLVPTVLWKLLDESQECVVKVVLLLVLSLLHKDKTRRECLSGSLADEDLTIS